MSGLSKEIYNVFLGQLAQKWQVAKVRSAKNRNVLLDLCSKMNVFEMLFSHFKICQIAIFEPVDLGKGYIHLLKALKEEKIISYLKIG